MDSAETQKLRASILSVGGLQEALLRPWFDLVSAVDHPIQSAPGAQPPNSIPLSGVMGSPGDWATMMTSSLEAFGKMIDQTNAFAGSWLTPAGDSPLARLAAHPLADIGSGDSTARLCMEASNAWLEASQAFASHQKLQVQGWSQALQKFSGEFSNPAAADPAAAELKSLDQVLTHWSKVGEESLQAHSRTEEFLQSQAQVMRKTMAYRVARRRVVEASCRTYDIPTLTDLDEAFASIHELRREIRELRRTIESMKSQAPTAATPAAAAGADQTSTAADGPNAPRLPAQPQGSSASGNPVRKNASTRTAS